MCAKGCVVNGGQSMKLHFKEPIAFGELSKMVMPSSAEEAAGTFTRYSQCGESSVK